ncbi:MAG: Gfo/Idh/MocA family oxidoreductase [Granulosicoccus sp.]
MIIIDEALRRRAEAGKPVRVGIVGAGFMCRGIVNQIMNHTPGMVVVAIANRTLSHAAAVWAEAGIPHCKEVSDAESLAEAFASNVAAISSNSLALCESDVIDVLVEATGHVEFGARVISAAIACGKPVVNMNAELDATVGPWLAHKAREAGVALTGCDGDQPAAQINLYRFVKTIGLEPLVCGNIKGLEDRYRNPQTQASFAKQWGQSATMVTSFADGTKISFEQAIVANATGMSVVKRGMLGLQHTGHVDELTTRFDVDELRNLGGVVDYAVGPTPGPGVFVFAAVPEHGSASDQAMQAHYLRYGKLGDGPLYSFYTPYHLTVFEVALSIARLVLFDDLAITPIAAPCVEVLTLAKTNLSTGDVIDGLGGFSTYGVCETARKTAEQNLLPMGLAEGCVLKRDVSRDTPLCYADVTLPKGRVATQLRIEQDQYFSTMQNSTSTSSNGLL